MKLMMMTKYLVLVASIVIFSLAILPSVEGMGQTGGTGQLNIPGFQTEILLGVLAAVVACIVLPMRKKFHS
jgi:hypothetical protein